MPQLGNGSAITGSKLLHHQIVRFFDNTYKDTIVLIDNFKNIINLRVIIRFYTINVNDNNSLLVVTENPRANNDHNFPITIL